MNWPFTKLETAALAVAFPALIYLASRLVFALMLALGELLVHVIGQP